MSSKNIKIKLKNFNKRLVKLQLWLGLLDKIFSLGAYLYLVGFSVYGLSRLGLDSLPIMGIVVGLTYIIFRHHGNR